jgi:hypothetical protein
MHPHETMTVPSRLSDDALVAEIGRLAGCERSATAALIAHLAEFDARRLHLAAGFESLFAYCTEVLRLSEHEAYNRIEVARLARRFPRVVDRVAAGALTLTTARLLAPHLTEENHETLLSEASHKSKRGVQELIVRYAPRPSVPSSIRKLPARQFPMASAATATAATAAAAAAGPVGTAAGPVDAAAGPVAAAVSPFVASLPVNSNESVEVAQPEADVRKPALVRPLAPQRYEIRFTASAETCEKLRRATDLIRHVVPDGDIAEVLDRALDVFLEDLARKKFAATPRQTSRECPATAPSAGRHIPAAVKRAVWLRDGERCSFVGKGRRRCTATAFLEFHHVQPHAVGGGATADNIQIRCRAHNAYEADLFYGSRGDADPVPGDADRLQGADGRRPGHFGTRSGTS